MSSNPNHLSYAKLESTVRSLEETVAQQGVQIDNLQATLDDILSLVNDIKTQVGPTLDSLMQSPMLKMLTGGK